MTRELPSVETERLILRPWKQEDLLPFSKINSDPKVMEFFPNVLSIDESETMLKTLQERFHIDGFSFWATELKSTHELIGFIGLNIPRYQTSFSPFVEIGWRLGSDHWGKGYASEGAKASLHYGFNDLKLLEIVSFTAVQNLRSQRVMEKIGMDRDLKGDFHHPSLDKDHWLSKHVLYRKKLAPDSNT